VTYYGMSWKSGEGRERKRDCNIFVGRPSIDGVWTVAPPAALKLLRETLIQEIGFDAEREHTDGVGGRTQTERGTAFPG